MLLMMEHIELGEETCRRVGRPTSSQSCTHVLGTSALFHAALRSDLAASCGRCPSQSARRLRLKCALLALFMAYIAGIPALACCIVAAVLLLEHHTPSLYILEQRMRLAAAR